jgi:hypothetical protein
MNRLDELTLRLADGDLAPVDEQELQRLLAGADAEERRRHASLLRLEAALRGERREVHAVEPVMEHILEARQERVVEGVLREIQGRPRPGASPPVPAGAPPPAPAPLAAPARSRLPGSFWVATFAGAASLAAAVALVWRADGTAQRELAAPPPAPAARTFAAVVSLEGAASAHRRGRVQALAPGLTLAPGDRVETSAGAAVSIRYQGRTTLALGSQVELTLEDPQRSRDRLSSIDAQVVHVGRGAVRAEVGPQPPGRAMIFLTPHARVTVVGTRLALLVGAAETALEVTEGHVLFERLDRNTIEDVRAGQRAVALAESAPPADTAPAGGGSLPPVVVFSFDFEDGLIPPAIKQGAIVTGPCRPGSRYCAIGMMDPYDWRSFVVAAVAHAVAYYSENLVLSFDYWAGADERRVWVQAWNVDKRQNHHFYLANTTPETWTHVEVRLADAAGERRRPWQPGDQIQNIRIHGGKTGGRPFYVDNIRLIDRPQPEGGGP